MRERDVSEIGFTEPMKLLKPLLPGDRSIGLKRHQEVGAVHDGGAGYMEPAVDPAIINPKKILRRRINPKQLHQSQVLRYRSML